MPISQAQIKDKDAVRYSMLRHLYERTNGSPRIIVPFFDLAAAVGVADDAAQDAFEFLRGEQLLRPMTLGGGVSITHQGVREVEASITQPDSGTAHFQPPTFHFYGPVGGVQSGGGDTMTVDQTGSAGSHHDRNGLTTLRTLLMAARPDDRVNAGVLLSAMEGEASKITPNPSLIRALGDALARLLPASAGDQVRTVVARVAAA